MTLKRSCIVMLLLFLPVGLWAQSQNWWTANQDSPNRESGKLDEIKGKSRVFVNVVFSSADPQVNAQQERDTIRRLVDQAIKSYPGLEIVPTADRAELAISIVASYSDATPAGGPVNFAASLEPGAETPLHVAVVVRGAMQRDGNYRPRVVWELSSPNVRGEPASAAVFAVDGFIGQLKKLKGK